MRTACRIVAGFGFSSRATENSLADALAWALTSCSFEEITTVALACPASKIRQFCFQEFVRQQSPPALEIADELLAIQPTVTQSVRSLEIFQTGSVAEAAALAGARLLSGGIFEASPLASLCARRVISSDGQATAALARLGSHFF